MPENFPETIGALVSNSTSWLYGFLRYVCPNSDPYYAVIGGMLWDEYDSKEEAIMNFNLAHPETSLYEYIRKDHPMMRFFFELDKTARKPVETYGFRATDIFDKKIFLRVR